MENKPKVYAKGLSFKEKRTSKGKVFFNLYITERFIEFFNENKNAKGGLALDAWPLDVPDKYNNTHNVVVNDFVPQQQGQQQADAASMQNFNASVPDDVDPLPF